ncbi:MAG: hypothetical protein NT069_08960, partial [Planctomycetota bacterium]|nr:hypothetical protein [Planctomycetota bacterium]
KSEVTDGKKGRQDERDEEDGQDEPCDGRKRSGGMSRPGRLDSKILFIPFILFILLNLLSVEPWEALDESLSASRDAQCANTPCHGFQLVTEKLQRAGCEVL